MLSRIDLHEYQERGVSFIKERKRCALWLDMGLGKTTTTLTAISDLLDSFAVARVLIIAPLRVANSVWPVEIKKWQHLTHLQIAVVTGSERERISALQKGFDICAINRENAGWLVDFYGKKWPFDAVVIDESSSFKNASSQRFKALKKILPFTNYFVNLTGTPSPNGLLDVWAQTYLLDFGESLGRTMTNYKNRFFEADYMGYKFTPRAGSAEKIQNALAPLTLSMSANDYLELPERIDLIEAVTLPPKIQKAYCEFERELFAEFSNGDEIEALSAAALAGKLLQWCNGAVYVDALKNFNVLHDCKLDALAEIIENNDGENILVAYNFKSDLDRLKKRFPQAVQLDKNPDTVNDWNNGKIKLLLAHPASAGHGLNLQHGGALAVWFGLTWSLENYLQFNARLHRQGQTRPVRIVHIVAAECIDSRIMSVIAEKDATQLSLLTALK